MPNLLRIYLLFILFYFTVFNIDSCFSQQPHFKNYTIENGLPSSTVYYIFQDSKGYIWLGTDAGISKYDGYQFTNYTTENGLSDNEVFSIHEDRKGRLWFLTLNGCPSYFQNNKFHSPQNDSILQNSCLDHFLITFLEDSEGTIFIGSAKGGVLK